MSKEQWFENFERVLSENPGISNERASDLVRDQQTDQMADKADLLKDEKKHGE